MAESKIDSELGCLLVLSQVLCVRTLCGELTKMQNLVQQGWTESETVVLSSALVMLMGSGPGPHFELQKARELIRDPQKSVSWSG